MNAQNEQGEEPAWGSPGPPPPPVGPPQERNRPPEAWWAPSDDYAPTTKGRVRYVPITRHGDVVGYLWASPTENAASVLRRLQSPHETIDGYLVWVNRLDEAFAQGVPAVELLQRWAGEPEDPEGGRIDADAPVQEAASLAELYELANPGGRPPYQPTEADEAMHRWASMDRSKDWGPLSPFTLEKPGYSLITDSAVRYLPVTKDGTTLGYLWASPTETAAGYQPRGAADTEGLYAGRLWRDRLEQCAKEGLTPLQAIRRWKGEPQDPQSGGITADAQEQEAPSQEALKEIAAR